MDGTNVQHVYDACHEAVERARRGEGPSLIESVTMRMQGHSASDDASYVPPAMLEEWRKKDPLERYEKTLVGAGLLTDALKTDIERHISSTIDDAVKFAEQSIYPSGSNAQEGVFAP